ncbi:nitrate- and nitrite sensing domain-containing protein [Nocardia sp. NPDC046763]|uniref:sensor histidine kinase n=1 Tax=Nocardia sp. NPDC046763 TaxID=3155256 RepID=UPI003406DA6A
MAIAVVPSLALVVIGVGAAGTLVDRSDRARTWADELRAGIAPAREMIEAVQAERQLTLWRVAGAGTDPQELAAARTRLDAALRGLAPVQSRLSQIGPQSLGARTDAFGALSRQLAVIRTGVDTRTISVGDVYQFYSGMPELMLAGIRIAEQTAPDSATAVELADSAEVLQSLEAMSRANALAAALIDGSGFTPELNAVFVQQIGYYRNRVERILTDQNARHAATAKDIVTGQAWQRLGAVETALAQQALSRTDGSTNAHAALPVTVEVWQSAAGDVHQALADLWQSENTEAQRLASAAASDTTRKSMLAGAGMLIVSFGAIVVAVALANRIIRRLTRLRDRTFALADEELPETMRRLAAGEDIGDRSEPPRLDFGRDEIGQVAEAFGHAHSAAVSAAVTEARTREGVKAVFLNIAHRSQIVMHRQLELLDQAQSRQEDPELLDTFFRLDHLATRERRNAENLVILGGGRPGRQWRNPVPLMELVRSAVGETLDYTRVRTGRLPDAFIAGVAVADLIHLLAELIDNATTFSPPQSRVEISGASVGRGVAVEIDDQGMGIPVAELERINALLSAPPGFGVTTLSADSRLGLFVVSQLAARHGITVRLSESDYGGIRAIVLVPDALIAAEVARGESPTQRWPRNGRAEYLDAPREFPAVATPTQRAVPAAVDRPSTEPSNHAVTEHAADHPPTIRPARAGKPALPRRRRQASLAPELARDTPVEGPASPPLRERSAEQARNLFSAIENGTRQGRRTDPDTQRFPTTHGQKDDGERLPY